MALSGEWKVQDKTSINEKFEEHLEKLRHLLWLHLYASKVQSSSGGRGISLSVPSLAGVLFSARSLSVLSLYVKCVTSCPVVLLVIKANSAFR